MSIDEEVMAKSIDDVNRRRQIDGVAAASPDNTESPIDSRPRRNSAPAYLINDAKSPNVEAPDEDSMATSIADVNSWRHDNVTQADASPPSTESVDSKPELFSAPSPISSAIFDYSMASPAKECAAPMAEDLSTPAREFAAPMAKDTSHEVEQAEVRGRTRRDSDEISDVSSEDSIASNMELADAGLEAGPLAKTSVGGRSGKISRSASSTLKTVKARVKRTFSKRSKSSPASMSTVVVRNQPALSMDWLRKVIPLKGCFSIPVVKA
jgi:hypothetical protein